MGTRNGSALAGCVALVVAGCLIWLSMRDAELVAPHGGGAVGAKSVGASAAFSGNGVPPIERNAAPVAPNESDPSGLSVVEVAVVSAADRSFLSGMQVTLLRPGRGNAVSATAPVLTGPEGSATVEVPRGQFAIVVNDPNGAWVMEDARQRPMVVSVPCPRMVVRMSPCFEGQFMFVGDKPKSVEAGAIPGFDLNNSLLVSGERVSPISVKNGIYKLRLIPMLPTPQRESWVAIDVIGETVGKCSFAVPVSRAGAGGDPFICDMRTANARPLMSVTISVADIQGRNIDMPISLDAPEHVSEVGVSGRPVRVPSGYQYFVSLGDPFPIHWTCANPALRSQLDLSGSTTGSVDVAIVLPVSIASKKIAVFLDKVPMRDPAGTVIRVIGSWGAPDCRGVGCPGLTLEHVGSQVPLPLGEVMFEIETDTLTWRKSLVVDEGPDLRIDLTASEGVSR